MVETPSYFIPNPDAAAPMGLLEVPITGPTKHFHDAEKANCIRRAIDAGGVVDEQALVMELLYRGGDIPRELVPHVKETLEALDVAWRLRSRLYQLAEAQPESAQFSDDEAHALASILETGDRDGIGCLVVEDDPQNPNGREGLLSTWATPMTPYAHDAFEPLRLTEEETAVARQLNTPISAYQTELVWRQNEAGEKRPLLLSGRQHTSLGHIAADGMYTPVATVLAPEHPLRQPDAPAAELPGIIVYSNDFRVRLG